jgi:hypothetical protein
MEDFIKSPYDSTIDYDELENKIRHYLSVAIMAIINKAKEEGEKESGITSNMILIFLTGATSGAMSILPEPSNKREEKIYIELGDFLNNLTDTIMEELNDAHNKKDK